MKPKNLLILVVIAAVLAGAAVLKNRRQRTAADASRMGAKLVVDVDLNKVAAIAIRSGESTVELAQSGNAWVAPGRYGYPARFDKIKEFVLKLAELKIGFEVSADDQDRALLKLLAPVEGTSSDATGTEVKLIDAGGAALASFIFGEKMTQSRSEGSAAGMSFPSGQYVALADGRVVVVDESLYDLGHTIGSWLDTALVEVPATQIQEVTLTATNGAVMRINRKQGSSDFEVAELADGEEVEAYKLSNLTGALASLSFSDVADPALDPGVTGFDRGATYVARSTDGKVVTVTVGAMVADESDRYMRLQIDYEEPPAPATDAADEDAGAEAAAAERAKKLDAVAAEVREQNARFSKWVFVIDSYRGDTLMMSRGDLVKQKEEPEELEETGQDADGVNETTPSDPGDESPDA
tara:strand:+ start:2221 stop:3450 length:1230 start_codon:yes stop_codon:yes gene_type:complete